MDLNRRKVRTNVKLSSTNQRDEKIIGAVGMFDFVLVVVVAAFFTFSKEEKAKDLYNYLNFIFKSRLSRYYL
jgi:hypothetical protein